MEPNYVELIPRRRFIDTADLSADDLSIFIESMETISRVKRERHERRQRRKNQKLNALKLTVKAEVHPTPRSSVISTEDSSGTEEDFLKCTKPICQKQLRSKLVTEDISSSSSTNNDVSPGHSSDENYFSGASRSESPTDSNKESIDGVAILSPPTDSGTESECGVYQLRPRSYAMTNPKYRTTRARIIGLVLKREYADGGSQDELEKKERCERLLEGLLQEKEKCESLRLKSKECRKPIPGKQPTAEMRFIDKALRYLTL